MYLGEKFGVSLIVQKLSKIDTRESEIYLGNSDFPFERTPTFKQSFYCNRKNNSEAYMLKMGPGLKIEQCEMCVRFNYSLPMMVSGPVSILE